MSSDTLEEIEPRVQRDLIDWKKKKQLNLYDTTPGQAADILSILPASESEEILCLIAETDKEKRPENRIYS